MLMLSMSALYVHVGVTNDSFNASLTAVQPVVRTCTLWKTNNVMRVV